MQSLNKYDTLVIKEILANKEFSITEVLNFENKKSAFFDREQYPKVISLLKQSNWEELDKLVISQTGFGEYLEIVIFSDENSRSYVATIYDSDELYQDPQLIDIFLLNAE